MSRTSDFTLHTSDLPSGIQIIPVHDRVEAERVGAVRLPSPEGANGEHHDVAIAKLCVDDGGAVREELAVGERSRQQQVAWLLAELDHHARTRLPPARTTLRTLADFCGFLRAWPRISLAVTTAVVGLER